MFKFTKRTYVLDILIILIAISFIFLTRIQTADSVLYDNKVVFTSYDSYYHARLIQNTVHNFPHRIWFDPYSLYPFGQPVVFGPLYDLIVAFAAIVIGLGNPSSYLIEITAAFFPMLFAMLSVPLVYLISKVPFNRLSAVISVIVFSVMNGEFLHRSMFGNADHHMAELFFSLLFVLFFILFLKKRKIVYSILAGLIFGCYFLIWYGAVIFSLIIFTFLVIIHFQNKKHEGNNYFKNISIIMLFPLVFYLLFATGYSPYTIRKEHYVLILIIPIFIAFFISKIKIYYKKILISSLGVLIFLSIIFRFKIMEIVLMIKSLLTLNKTVSEMSSVFTLTNLSWHFYLLLIISFISLLLLFYDSNKNGISLFMGIWSTLIILLSLMQIRFTYYLPANIAILIGYGTTRFKNKKKLFVYIILILLMLIPASIDTFNNAKKFNPNLKEIYLTLEWLKNNTPELNLSYYAYYKNAERISDYVVYNNSLVCEEERETRLNGDSIPYSSYQSINLDKKIKNNSCKLLVDHNAYRNYNYPNSAYSIMNVYPYGHLITYIARRIPVTNGFLFFIGLNPSEKFFIAQEENKSKDILNNFNAKYLILDDFSIYAIQYMAARLDNKNSYVREIKLADNKQKIYMPNYYKSVAVRLYLYNGKEYSPKKSYILINNEIRKFNNYKLALEYQKKHNNSIIVGINPYESPVPLEKINDFQLVYESNTTLARNSLGEIKKIKIFSYTT